MKRTLLISILFSSAAFGGERMRVNSLAPALRSG